MELTPHRCEVECLHPEHVGPLLGKVVTGSDADDLAAIFALLADPTRARLLHALSLCEELCVCDLALLLGRSESALSHQLRVLRDRRVVSRRKAGRIAYYRLADDHIRHVLDDGLRHAREHAARRGRTDQPRRGHEDRPPRRGEHAPRRGRHSAPRREREAG